MRAFFSGGCSSVGRVPDCDSGCRGFEPHQSPQKTLKNQVIRPSNRVAFLLSGNHGKHIVSRGDLLFYRKNIFYLSLNLISRTKPSQFTDYPAHAIAHDPP
jgi:hypothetical protein